jgi:hypothetical protein
MMRMGMIMTMTMMIMRIRMEPHPLVVDGMVTMTRTVLRRSSHILPGAVLLMETLRQPRNPQAEEASPRSKMCR